MRIDLLAIGSRGDVQPCVALGVGLRQRGHDVRVVTMSGFESLVGGRGVAHLSLAQTVERIADTTEGREWVKRRATTVGFARGFVRVARALVAESIAQYWKAARSVDAIVASPMGLLLGTHIAERLGVPLVQAHYAPVARTRYDWEGRRNLATIVQGEWREVQASLFRRVLWRQLRHTTNHARRHVLELPPLSSNDPFRDMDRRQTLQLYAYSEAIAQRPPDWGSWIHVTGYWFLDDREWSPPREIAEFLASGPPPVFVGFGSTPFPDPDAATRIVVGALSRAGRRGIVLAGGSGLATGRLSDGVLSIEAAPHDWLFSKVCAAVHHGGAGVTGAALRAGLPSVVVPIFGDQPFWASRVFDLGAGPPPLPARQLTERSLAERIRAAASHKVRRSADDLGRRIRAEDGIGRAIDVLDAYVASREDGHVQAGLNVVA